MFPRGDLGAFHLSSLSDMKTKILLLLAVLLLHIARAAPNHNETVTVHIPSTGWVNGSYRSMIQATWLDAFGTLQSGQITYDSVTWTAGQVYTRVISVQTITGHKWAYTPGAPPYVTNTSYGTPPVFYIDAPPPPEASVCFTNTTQQGGIWTLKIGTPPDEYTESMTMMPGDYWCVDSEEAFILNIQEIFGTIEGPPATNETPIFSWDPGQGSTNAGGGVNPPPAMVNTQGGAFSNPSNDTQNAANGIVGQLQRNQQQENINDNRLAGLLEEIRDKVATNMVADDSLTNKLSEAVAAGNTTSNLVGAQLGQTNALMSAASSSGGSLASTGLDAVSFTGGDSRLSLLVFDFASMPEAVGLRNWVWRLFLYSTKLICIAFAFRHMLKVFADFGKAMKGNGTSGFLQAAIISVPNLASSLGGMAVRWKVAAAIVPFIFAAVVGGVAQIDSWTDMPTNLADLAPSAGVLAYGWKMVTYFIPLELMFRAVMVTMSGCVLMSLTVFGATIITDATSKA